MSVLCAPPRDSGWEVTAGARSRVSQVRQTGPLFSSLRRFRSKRRGACDVDCRCRISTRFVFLDLTHEPISVPVSYLLKGVGIFFGLANTLHQRHDLPLGPSRPQFSQSEAHMSRFVMGRWAQPSSCRGHPTSNGCVIRLRHGFSSSSLWCMGADPLYSN
jgi:hypothetical protein